MTYYFHDYGPISFESGAYAIALLDQIVSTNKYYLSIPINKHKSVSVLLRVFVSINLV